MTHSVKSVLATLRVSCIGAAVLAAAAMPAQADGEMERITCTFDDGSGHFVVITNDQEHGDRMVEACLALGGSPSFG